VEKKKEVIEVTKPVPKFLQAFKYQQPEEEEEVTIESKFQKDEPENNDDEEYDVENAQVYDENGDPIKKEGEDVPETDDRTYENDPKLNKKVTDIATFHPTFKTKKQPGNEEHKADVEKEVKKSKDENKSKEDINSKRSLESLVKGYIKEDKQKHEPKVNKKIKSSLLSFGDDD